VLRYRPLPDRVLLRRVTAEEKSRGGMIIPGTARETPGEGHVIVSIGLELGTGIGAQWGTTCAAGGGLSR
jgi:co-chaperonin GroES (HSP10)